MSSRVACLVIDCMNRYLRQIVVPISSQTCIFELKELLKGMAPAIFSESSIDISLVEVWKCPALKISQRRIPEEFREFFRTFDFSNNQAVWELSEFQEVSSLGLEDEMLLVRLPSPLWCLAVDRDQRPVGNIIPVTVSPIINVFNVAQMVLATNRIEIGITEIIVWRCFGLKTRGYQENAQAFEARLRAFDLSNKLHTAKLLGTRNVLELKVPPDELLLVQLLNIGQEKRKYEEIDDPPEVKRLKTQTMGAPSMLAPASQFRKIAGPEGRAVGCNRPFEASTIPLVLLHEAFAIFKDRCEQPPSSRALACLNELAPVACEWHDMELNRWAEIQTLLRGRMHLPFSEQKVPNTEYTTDGNLPLNIMPAAIRECKNEHGVVLNQAILYYAKFLKCALDDPLRFYNFNTRFPSILMVDMGSYMGFYGAVWDGKRIRVEPLTPLFDLSIHWRDTRARYAIAAAFDALEVATASITAHYDSIQAMADENPPPPKERDSVLEKARGYPFLTSYGDNGQEIKFKYSERLSDDKLVFCATTVDQPNSDKFLVKFTSQYSEDAHNCLASHNFAPRLRRCIQISADWIAVIMDESKYQMLYNLPLLDSDKEKVQCKVRKIVHTLHQEGFVHGDVRDTNLLIDVESLASDDVKIHLVDFDWAGPIGEAKYPVGINTMTVQRPDGVEDGAPITELHDINMVSLLYT